MDLFSELITATQSDLTIGDESSLYPPTTIKLALNRSYRKCGGLFRWPELEDAQKTSTESGSEYYDYPDNWQPDSLWKLELDGERIGEDPDGSPLRYDDYLNWKEDESNSTEKKWSTQWRRFFISPTPTTDGNNNISIWGQKVVEALVDNEDVTIFSYSLPECNEAVVMEAVAILKAKGELEKSSQFRSNGAKEILVTAWNKIRQNQAKYEKVQPMLDVPDYFSRTYTKGRSTRIGNF